jgi:plastocyanin
VLSCFDGKIKYWRDKILSKFSFFLALPFVAVAQYGYGPATSAAAPASSASSAPASAPSAPADTANQFNVDVAFNKQFVFNPNNMTVPPGSLVTFYFPSALAHSVTQSSFANPCTYLAANGSNSAGFDSGLTTSSTFTINVTDTSAIWYFCKHPTHCGLGMVGSINAPATGNTFANFQAAAMAIGSAEPTLTDNGPVTGGLHGVATAGPTSDVGAATSTKASSATKVIGGSAAFLSAILAAIFMA